MRTTALIALAAGLATFGATPATAQNGSALIDNFDDWSAFAATEGKAKVCYVGGVPKKQDGAPPRRGDTYLMITHRPAEKRIGEVSLIAGYAFKKDSRVEVEIDGKKFDLFTQGETAWGWDAPRDAQLAAAMRTGRALVVRGTPAKGAAVTDTYSLKGFSAAWTAASAACGVK